MENLQRESSFKSPTLTSLLPRSRPGSGSSASSTEKESPLRFSSSGSCQYHHFLNNGIGGAAGGSDENDPPACSSSSSGGEHVRVNPFEKDQLAGLQRSFWSPSIMEINDTPPQRSWAIEHLSHLFPKDIENSPTTHQNAFPVDPQTEAKAQADIDTYFSRGPIVPTPSPMKEHVTKIQFTEISHISKSNVSYMHCGQSPITTRGGGSGLSHTISLIKKKKLAPAVEKWTQTTLSFPVDLPPDVQEILSQYGQMSDLCGSSGDTYDCSKKAVATVAAESVDNDSTKNSSSLNNSIRRRLELSFGEDPDGEDSNGLPLSLGSPIVDPFRRNHVVSTPPGAIGYEINTTTTELELQLRRCEFTPEARGMPSSGTPAITPIQDEPADDFRSPPPKVQRRS